MRRKGYWGQSGYSRFPFTPGRVIVLNGGWGIAAIRRQQAYRYHKDCNCPAIRKRNWKGGWFDYNIKHARAKRHRACCVCAGGRPTPGGE